MSRDALREHLWGEDTVYLDHETAINTCIRRLRTVLGDDASRPTFILTLPGKGYRFIAPVSVVAPAEPRTADEVHASSTRTVAPVTAVGNVPSRGRLLTLILLGLLLVVSVAWIGARSMTRSVPLEGRATLDETQPIQIVLTSDVLSEVVDATLGETLTEGFRIGIEQSPAIRVLSRMHMRDALERMEHDPDAAVSPVLAREMAQREGAALVAVLRVRPASTGVALGIELIDPVDGVPLGDRDTAVRHDDDYIPALNALLAWTAERLDVADPERIAPLETVTTSNLRALRLYTSAMQLRCKELDTQEVVDLLEHAVEADTKFAMAHAKLGSAYWNTGRPDQAATHLRRAVEIDQLPEFERLYTLGWLAQLEADADTAIQTWQLLRDLYPSEYVGHINLCSALVTFRADFEGCLRVAASPGARALATDSRQWLDALMGISWVALGAFDEAREIFAQGDGATFRQLEPDLHFSEQNYAGYERAMQLRDENDPERATSAAYREALISADRGDFSAAAARALASADTSTVRGWHHQEQAALLMSLAFDAAAQRAGVASSLDSIAVRERLLTLHSGCDFRYDSRAGQLLALLAITAARAGDVDEAQAMLDRASRCRAAGLEDLWRVHIVLAETEIAFAGAPSVAAITTLEDAVATHPTVPLHALEAVASRYHEIGAIEQARRYDQRVVAARGRAVVECLGSAGCFDLAFNVVAWNRSAARLRAAGFEVVIDSRSPKALLVPGRPLPSATASR